MTELQQKIVRWETCGRAWIGLLRHVWSAGEAGLVECGPIIEGPPVFFEISSLTWDDPLLRQFGETPRARGGMLDRAGYAARLQNLQGVDQIRWVVDLLRARPWTTNAWISLTVLGEHEDAVPSLVALAFRIRGYRLTMTAMFRCQNVFTGYKSYLPLRGVQLKIADDLGLSAGPLRIFIDLPYVYVADAEDVATVLSSLPEPNVA